MTTRKSKSAPGESNYVATRALSIYENAYMPGDALREKDLSLLPPGRLKSLVRAHWVRPVGQFTPSS